MTCDDEHGDDWYEIDPDCPKVCWHCFLGMCSEFGPCDKTEVKCPCLCATRWSGG